MPTVTAVTATKGVSQSTGKPWTRYDVTLDDGTAASGFSYVKVGDEVEVFQKGDFLNFKPTNRTKPPVLSGPLPGKPVQQAFPVSDGTDRSSRIERQHSQEMAIRYAALKGLNQLDTDGLRALIDWFQRDVGRVPLSVIEQKAKTMFKATEVEPELEPVPEQMPFEPDDDEGEPF